MKWKKLGKLFDPTKYQLVNNCYEFAQSPQTLIFDDFVRIYFSTREKDQTGKYLSHISFVDVDNKLEKIINIATKTVIPLGDLGCYDEHGIFPLNIFRDKNQILGYIGGWSRRVSVPVETSIGLAISTDDGLTFKRIGPGPVLTSSLNEPFLVGDPFVTKNNGVYHMLYIFGTRWVNDPENNIKERVYKIGHAFSNDGIYWNKTGKQIIRDKLNINECQALPTVIRIKNNYHMYFCYRQAIDFRNNKDNAYRIGYAYSNDFLNWERDDKNVGIDVSVNDWDSDMICYPHLFQYNEKIYLLYNGNEFGRFGFGLAVLEN
jgi:hypothetical protein